MKPTFQHIALIGKYHAPHAQTVPEKAGESLRRIASFLSGLGCEVILDIQSAIYDAID